MFKRKAIWGLIAGLLLILCCPVMASAASDTLPVTTYEGGKWKTTGNKKYYKVDKKKITGWAMIDEKVYFFSRKGVMYTGWKDYKGQSYFFDTKKMSGAMVTGGFYNGDDGKLYYFKESGASAKGTFSLKTDGVKNYYYARKKNHALARRMWSNKAGGQWYYYDSDGVRHAKWFSIDDKRYYCSPQKGKLSGWNTVGGVKYYFTDKGFVAVSQWIPSADGEKLCYVNETGAVEKEVAKDAGTSADYGDIIMVGDSRFYHTYYRYGITADNVTWIAKSKMGYNWLENTAYPQIEQQVRMDYMRRHSSLGFASEQESAFGRTAIVLNLGVNDLTNINFYLQFVNGRLKKLAEQYGCDLYYVSVNPIDTQKFLTSSVRRTPWIMNFNSEIKSGLDPACTFIDTYGYLTSRYGTDYSKITVEDGLHYDEVISRVIFSRILTEIAPKE